MFPDFLCIGAQKAGTTWLYRNLKLHPEIWLPPWKEIHYFDRAQRPNQSLAQRVNDAQWRRTLKRRLRGNLREVVKQRTVWQIPWDLKFFFSRQIDDTWYESLFEAGRGFVKGDLTPAYGTLDKEAARHAHRIMPDAKIIFILRNPIDRAWSAARMNVWKRTAGFAGAGSDVANVSTDQLITYFQTPQQKLRGDYVRTLGIWRSVFPEDQIFVGFLEDIAARPDEFLEGLYGFLDVSLSFQGGSMGVEPNRKRTGHIEMPAEVARFLGEMYYDQIVELKNLVHGPQVAHVEQWLEKASELRQL